MADMPGKWKFPPRGAGWTGKQSEDAPPPHFSAAFTQPAAAAGARKRVFTPL